MPSSTPSRIKFLLDENVSHAMLRYLVAAGYDAVAVNKGSDDQSVARRSLSEQRILITNDLDFASYNAKQVYGVIWLRIAQHDKQALLEICQKLLDAGPFVKGCLVVLRSTNWQLLPLPQRF